MSGFVSSLREEFDPDRDAGREDPAAWLEHRMGGAVAWSRQLEILRALETHQRVAVPSCHAAGKSQLAAWAVARFIDIHEPGEAMVVTSAPRAHQVKSVLWRYIRRAHSAGNLAGKINQGPVPEWYIDGDLVGFGRKPADMDSQSWQGIHELNLLIVFDEACGMREAMFTAAETLMTSQNCRWLCIGNPDDRSSFFHKICSTEPGWKVMPISAYQTPNWTGEPVPARLSKLLVQKDWIIDKETRWGRNSPLFQAKVLGEFADAESGLVPLSWANAAIERWHEWMETADRENSHPAGRTVIGVDPAWSGADKSAVVVRKDNIIYSAKTYDGYDTGQLASVVLAEMSRWTRPVAVIDTIGIGAGVYDQVRSGGGAVVKFNGSSTTQRTDRTGTWGFPNCRSASWHGLREALDPTYGSRLTLPDNDDLIADITAPTYEPAAGGKLVVEPKARVKARIGRSPDLGDALAMSLWAHPLSPRSTRTGEGGWGKPIPWEVGGSFGDLLEGERTVNRAGDRWGLGYQPARPDSDEPTHVYRYSPSRGGDNPGRWG